jgi:hypothetical protein
MGVSTDSATKERSSVADPSTSMQIWIWSTHFTLMWVRIRHSAVMRIRIRMRIHLSLHSFLNFDFDADPDPAVDLIRFPK